MWDILLVLFFIYIITVWALRKLRISIYGNHHVFITGCDTGFGHLLALQLDGLGLHVYAGCFTEEGARKLSNKSSDKLKTIIIDITNEDDIRNAVLFVEKNLPERKGLWGLVNNAGIAGDFGYIELLRHADYQNVLSVNLLGTIDVTRAFLPLLRKAKGRVVNVSSMVGVMSMQGSSPYCLSKFGIEAFSDSLRREVSIFGVSVHIIEPGAFFTEIVEGVLEIGKTQSLDRFDSATPEVQQAYGREYYNQYVDVSMELMGKYASRAVYKVPDAMTHALTSRFPKYRYVVGSDAFIVVNIINRFPTFVPDFLLTFMSNRMFKSMSSKQKDT